jgi:hypothetical protein
MNRRTTVNIDYALMKKLRKLQAKNILKNSKSENYLPSPSFSRIVNEILTVGLTKWDSSLGR